MIDIKGFLIAIIPIALSPGASFTLATSNVSIAGIRSAFQIILGTGLGILIHGALVGLGISSLIVKSPTAMNVLQIAGILFLGWLGVKLLHSGVLAFQNEHHMNSNLAGFKDALFLNLFNTKAIILYLTVVPTFAGEALQNYVLLSSLHVLVMAVWIIVIGLVIEFANKTIRFNILSGLINSMGGLFLLAVSYNAAMGLYNQV